MLPEHNGDRMTQLDVRPSAGAGPVAPTDSARCWRPVALSGVRLSREGFWGEWARRNREVTVPYGIEALVSVGNVSNLERVVGRSDAPYRGFVFNDSDIYKTLEAVAWLLAEEDDAALDSYMDEMAALLAEVQEPDGYLNSKVQGTPGAQRYVALDHSHELYTAGHLFQAAVADFRATGKTRLLDIATRLADHLVREFGNGARGDYDGHPEVETALVELFRATGRRPYLELASQFVERRGGRLFAKDADRRGPEYFQDHVSVREARQIVGHAVRALYLEAGVVDVATETHDAQLLEMSRLRWDDMVTRKLYLTGGLGSRHKTEGFGDPFELPPDRAYCETCAAIASIQWCWRLLLATGDSRYADLIERTLFNGFAAGIGVDGRSFFYSNPLQVRADHAAGAEEETGHRLPWYSCACCPPNVMRLVASLAHYVATVSDAGIQISQYADATITTEGVGLRMSTEYPWSPVVTITVVESTDRPWELALRIPSWSPRWTLTVDGADVDHSMRNGFAHLRRRWAAGETVTLTLDITPRLTYPDSRVDAVRDCVAIERGPLVYCIEGVDNDGVDLAAVTLPDDALLREHLMDDWPHVIAVSTTVLVSAGAEQDGPLYRNARSLEPPATTTQVNAIPYHLWANRRSGPMRVWI